MSDIATGFEGVELRRIPHRPSAPLRAWDAADEYALSHIAGIARQRPGRWIVVNDLFGALAVALHDRHPVSWGDSVTSHRATVENLARNGLDPSSVENVASTDDPVGPFAVAIVKVPRSLRLLDDQLRRLRPQLGAGATIVGAGMVKNVHRSTLELFESIIGPTTTSLAVKKARLIFATLDPALDPGPSPFPTHHTLDSGEPMVDHANVFSAGHLDIGARAMLEHLPSARSGSRVLDLGCGNGVLGLSVARRSSPASVLFVDESYQAVASARDTAAAWGFGPVGEGPQLEFLAACDLAGIESATVDLVVNNPPFHTHQTRTDDVARAMFADARRVLVPDGRLVVVANRHLGHHETLRRLFASVTVVGSTPKFVVLEATGARAPRRRRTPR